jgi:thermitase
MMPRWFRLLILLILTIGILPRPSRAEYAKDEVLVKYKQGSEVKAELRVRALGVASVKDVGKTGMKRVKLPKSLSVEDAIAKLKADPTVEYVGPNHILHITTIPTLFPNDDIFVNGCYDRIDDDYMPQWGLYNEGTSPRHDIHAPEAWAITTGSPSVPIAILDTGVDYTHPDLASKIWTNPGEIPGDGIDNDGNGFIDDVHGWDFVNGDNDPMDDEAVYGMKEFHGTFTASIAGAATNDSVDVSVGMAGVAWGCPIVPIKVAGADGSGLESDVAAGVTYAVDMGIKVINMSMAGPDDVPALAAAVSYAWQHGALCVCASGNEDVSTNMYPACYPTALAVGASNPSDQRCTAVDWGMGGSNYGSYLDVVAPGNSIVGATSFWDDQGYYYFDGTSASAPFVSGIAALLWSAHPTWSNQKVFLQITHTADDIPPAGYDIYTGYGRVNAYRALTENVQEITTISEAKSAAIGSSVSLSGVRLTTSSGEIANRLYVQEEKRSSGIMLYFAGAVPTGLADGDCVDVSGSVGVVSGERAIMSPTVTKRTDTTNSKPRPLAMTNQTTGGSALAGQVGVVNQYSYPRTMALGLNNIGLLVRTTGKVIQVGTNWFYLDDGSNLDDGTGNDGIYVDVGLTIVRPNTNKKIIITGISSCEILSGSPVARRVLRPRRQADIRVL